MNTERGQVMNYLRITGLSVGVILNFKRAHLEWERIVMATESSARRRVESDEPPDLLASADRL